MERSITKNYKPKFNTYEEQIRYFELYRFNLEVYLDETLLNSYARVRVENEIANIRQYVLKLKLMEYFEEHGHYPETEQREPTISDWGKVG